MPTRPNWKFAEDRLAKFFNTTRRPLSGLNHRTGRGDDAQHPRLYLESKYGSESPVVRYAWDLYVEHRDDCRRDGKGTLVPVIGLQKSNLPGILLVIHSSDFEAVCREYLTQLGYQLHAPDPKARKADNGADGSAAHHPGASSEVEKLPTVPSVKDKVQSRSIPRPTALRRTVPRRRSG